MPKKSNVTLTAKSLARKINNCEITFDNIIQRNLVWDKARKSLLIHSMITGWMPCPPLYCIKGEKSLDCIEGKQRSDALTSYLNDDYALCNIPDYDEDDEPFTTEDGTVINNINGKKFSELPEEFQDNIKDYTFSVQSFEDITSALISEIFIRINNGKPLSAIELAWVKCNSKQQIIKIIESPLFADILTPAAINKYADIKIAMFGWAALNQSNDDVTFESKKFRPLMADAVITDDQVVTIMNVLSKIQAVHQLILEKDGTDDEKKVYAKIAKRVATQTHLLSILPTFKNAIEKNVSDETMADWCLHFFTGNTLATISETYNNNSLSGTNNNAALKKRFNAVNLDYQTFIRAHHTAEEVEELTA